MSQFSGALGAITAPSLLSVADNLLETVLDETLYYIVPQNGSGSLIGFSRVMSLEVVADGKVVATPIAQNSFASYNKVMEPGNIKATLALEGEDAQLQSAIDTLMELRDSTDLVDFITPFGGYFGNTLEKFSYQQAAENGTNVLYVDVSLVEIREVEAQYTDAKAPKPITPKQAKKPGNASPQQRGNQQPKAKDPTLLKEGWDKIFPPKNKPVIT